MTPKLYKAADVCEMTGLQPYVLRSWEKEFPGIGLQKSADGSRLYRQIDVDQVVRIKQLVFSEGLTLAGARRRLEEAPAAPVSRSAAAEAESEVLDLLGEDARARIAAVRQGLRAILDALSKAPGTADIASAPQRASNGNGTPAGRRGGSSSDRRGEPSVDRRGGPSVDRRGGPSGPPKTRKAAVAAKRSAPSKRAAAPRKPARGTKRKRASA